MSIACLLYSSIITGAAHVFQQDIVNQCVDVAWILGWRVSLRGRVLAGSTCESLEVENGLLGRNTGLQGDIDESLPDLCDGLVILQ